MGIEDLALARLIEEREETRQAVAKQSEHEGFVRRAGRNALESYQELVKQLPPESEFRRLLQGALGTAMTGVGVALGE